MGILFSKKNTIKDRLLSLENEVLKHEYEANVLKRSGGVGGTLLATAILLPVGLYTAHLAEIPLLLALTVLVLFSMLWIYAGRQIGRKRIEYKERKLADLKEERARLVEQCKNDVDYAVTKTLIDKYEEDRGRETFFKQIQKKKKTAMDAVTGFVLGGDPTKKNALICVKCGVHNGLVDEQNDEFRHFECYNCSFKNERVKKQKRV